ncbi:MAG: AsmA-like C-terminal region-containing protein [Flavobacteriales bacterium]
MKFIKRLFLLFILLSVLVVGGLASYIYYKQNDLEQLIIKEVNKQLQSEVSINDITFSVLKNFPYTSINLNGVTIIDAFNEDTLCQVEDIDVKFNIIDIYNEDYTIQEIELDNGFVNIYYNEGKANYIIWESSSDSTSDSDLELGLENISLKNLKVDYTNGNISTSILSHESNLELKIDNEDITLTINGELTNNRFILNNESYLKNKAINLSADLTLNDQYTDISSNLIIAEIPLLLNLTSKTNSTDIRIKTKSLDVKRTLSLLPSSLTKSFSSFDIDAKTDLDIHLINDLKENSFIDIQFEVSSATLKGKDIPFDCNELSFQGSFTNGSNRTDASTSILINDIKTTINNEAILANAHIKGLNDPTIEASVNGQLQLSEIEKWGYKPTVKELFGKTTYEIYYNGKIGLKNKLTFDMSMAEKKAIIAIDDLTLITDNSTPKLSQSKLKLKLIDDHLDIEQFETSLAEESNLNFIGSIENVFAYSFLKNAPLKIGGDLSSKWMIIDELLENIDTSSTDNPNKSVISFPKDVIVNINLNLEDLTYDRFHMRNFNSKISYKEKKLNVKNVELETMSGKINSTVSLEQLNSGRIRLINTTNLNNINVRQLFYEFHNFGQRTMRHKHLKGKIDSEIYFRNEWDKFFNPIENHMYSFMDVTIKDGELLEFEPLMEMSDYISIEELKRIKFSTLENQIEIKNNVIEIPFMEIYSSAIDLAGSGTHTFDNNMDYEFKILLNEILGNKFRRKHKKKVTEFGVVEDDGVKGMALFLKMKGNVDDPEIAYNTLRLRESLDTGFKKEKRKLKEVINNEFGGKQNEDSFDDPNYDNIIEWEE